MGCQGVCRDSVDKHRQLISNPSQDSPPRPLSPKPSPAPASPQNKDTVVKGKAGHAQGLAEFRRSLASSKQPKQSSGQTASALLRDVGARQPEVAGHSGLDIGLHVADGAVEAAHLALELAGAATGAMLTGIVSAGLFAVGFVRGLRDAHVEGDRRVLRAAIAEGAARTLTEMCYPGRTDSDHVARGLDRFRDVKRVGNREGDPAQAYALGERVVREALAGRSPAEIQSVKQELVALMPGYQRLLRADDRPEHFQRALMEYLNADVAGRRVGH
jgi:hypothetical protein